MRADQLPLLALFQRLRDHGLSLGVEEYMAVLRALRGGFGLQDREALRQLCRSVWIKSEEEDRVFQRLFNALLAPPAPLPEVESPEPPPLPPGAGTEPAPDMPATEAEPAKQAKPFKEARPQAPAPVPAPPPGFQMEVDEPLQVVQAIRHSAPGEATVGGRSRYRLLTEYFPVTQRQMKQGWRHLRRPVREGPPEELDVQATIEKVGRDGILLEPVLLPRRTNRAEMILLVDQDGSMVPFHALSRQMVDTARRGGRLGRAGIYYFHDYPQDFLYQDPARLEAMELVRVLGAMTERTAVLILSDAGAARGGFDPERVERTREFLYELRQRVRHYAWLNPMPHHRWADTTAGRIAHLVPMFEMNRHGLDAAISALQGRYVYGEKLYPWMM